MKLKAQQWIINELKQRILKCSFPFVVKGLKFNINASPFGFGKLGLQFSCFDESLLGVFQYHPQTYLFIICLNFHFLLNKISNPMSTHQLSIHLQLFCNSNHDHGRLSSSMYPRAENITIYERQYDIFLLLKESPDKCKST